MEDFEIKMWKMNPVCWTKQTKPCPEQERLPDLLKAEMFHNRQNANSKNTPETNQLDADWDNREGGRHM